MLYLNFWNKNIENYSNKFCNNKFKWFINEINLIYKTNFKLDNFYIPIKKGY